MKPRDMVGLLKQTYEDWSNHGAQTMGASLAYFTVLSLAPLLVIAIAIAGLVFGKDAVQGQIVYEVGDLVGPAGAQTIQDILKHAQAPAAGTIATILGIVTLLLGASGVFNELRNALNKIWGVKPASSGIVAVIKDEIRSFGMVVGIGFLLLVSLVVSATLAGVGKFMAGYLPVHLLTVFNVVVSLAAITALFALMFRVVPATHVPWSDVWIGAGATAALFTAGKFLLGLYLGKATVGSAYGAAGSLIVLLVWVYYSAQIFLFGAEFTHVYATQRGSRRHGEPGAPKQQPQPVAASGPRRV